jgi:hypothetical protein
MWGCCVSIARTSVGKPVASANAARQGRAVNHDPALLTPAPALDKRQAGHT